MNTSMRARRDALGFSMVELLVTIIIAGIAFAALVPLFVNAQQQGAGAQYHTAAINLAQDRIERLRELPWSALTDDLTTTSPGGGLTWGDVAVGGKTYTVTLLPVQAVGSTQKVISVRVTWYAQPGHVQHRVVLSTNVFRQLPGPQVIDVSFSPPPDPLAPSLNNWIRPPLPASGVVNITATVNPAQALDCKRVRFTVVDMSGKLAPIVAFVETPDTGTNNLFTLNEQTVSGGLPISAWGEGVTLHDGLYRVTAVAYSKDTSGQTSLPGNTYPRDIRIEMAVPPEVAFTVYPGKVDPAVVNLLWSPSTAADWGYFQVWRRTADSAVWTPLADNIRSFGYMDLAVVGTTHYHYIVRAVDTAGNAMPLSDLKESAEASPTTTGAGGAPSRPTGLAVTFSGANVVLHWVPPTASAEIVGYHVYRVTGADPTTKTLVASASSVASAVSYTAYDVYRASDPTSIAWTTAYSYTVKSFTADGVESPVAGLATGQAGDGEASPWATVTTPAAPIYDLRMSVQNVKSGSVTVTVTPSGGGAAVASYSATQTSPAASRQVPYGTYTVSAGGKAISVSLTGDPAQPVYVSLSL